MRAFTVPDHITFIAATTFQKHIVVAAQDGVYIVTEDQVWLKVNPTHPKAKIIREFLS